jgi:gamma-glutamyltranspeptidase/glutathione hydrolase
MAAIFLTGRRTLRAGERLIQADLAGTLRAIAQQGRAGFYDGVVAEAIVRDMQAHGGLVTRADLDRYQVATREPVQGTYRGHRIVSMPPPSSGGVHVIQMLNILEGYDLAAMGRGSPDAVHVMAEAMRQAYADRAAFLGDPAFVHMPIERLLSAPYAAEVRARIPANRARPSETVRPLLAPPTESDSTTHLSIVDERGNIVSSTQTINYSFGACVAVPGAGIILNNEMDDFSARPGVPNVYGLVGGEANAIAPGKRPLSSMSPTIVFRDDKPWLVLGSPGGSRIITAVLQTLLHRIDFGMPIEEAVAAARMHHQWLPDRIELEADAWPHATAEALAARGHALAVAETLMGEVQAVERLPDGRLIGVSDPRRSGRPAGR